MFAKPLISLFCLISLYSQAFAKNEIFLDFPSIDYDEGEILVRRVLVNDGPATKWWGLRSSQVNLFKFKLQKSSLFLRDPRKPSAESIDLKILMSKDKILTVEIGRLISSYDIRDFAIDPLGMPVKDNGGDFRVVEKKLDLSNFELARISQVNSNIVQFSLKRVKSAKVANPSSHLDAIKEINYQIQLSSKRDESFFVEKRLDSYFEKYGFFHEKSYSSAYKWNLAKGPQLFFLDKGLPDIFEKSIRKSIAYWNEVFQRKIIALSDERKECNHSFSINIICWVNNEVPGATYTAQYHPRTGEALSGMEVILPSNWFKNRDRSEIEGKLTVTLAHELGHLLGFQHNFFTPWEGLRNEKNVSNSVMAYLDWNASVKLSKSLGSKGFYLEADKAFADFLYFNKPFKAILKAGFLSDHSFEKS